MSRETDSSSSGPQGGRGGSPYPQGTDPYRTGHAGDPADEAAAGADPDAGDRQDERKTETTLTTRIRINIPGSRPIPPVVMRTPVSDDEGGAGGPGAGEGQPRSPRSPRSASGGAAGTSGTSGTSRHASPRGAAEGGAEPGAGAGTSGGAPGGGGRTGEGGAGSAEFQQRTSDWFAPRKSKPAPPPADQGTPADRQEPSYGTRNPYGSGAQDPYGTGNTGNTGTGSGAGYGGADPYDTGTTPFTQPETPVQGPPGFPTLNGQDDSQRSALHGLLGDSGTGGGTGGTGGTGGRGGPSVPSGPTTGPATGEMRVPPQSGAGPAESPASSTLGLGTGPAPFAPGGIAEGMLDSEGLGAQRNAPAPGGPGSGSGAPAVDDTDGDDEGQVSGDTVVSGIARVPTHGGAPAAPSPFAESPSPSPFAGSAAASASAAEPRPSTSHGPRSAPRSRAAARAAEAGPKGRSKLALIGVGLVGVIGVAYGAGLLLDHADVPTGTKVLGVDLGGMTKHGATEKLEGALGDRTTQPLTVASSGKQTRLKPSVAGLTLDTEGTVRRAAGRDYNPVSVIGSLFGVERKPQPALKVDKEKMASALAHVSRETGDGGAPTDGMIKFIRGKAVPIHGKPHKGIDEGRAASALRKAYLARAESGSNSVVKLPVSLQQPKVGDKELKRAMRDFARPAMSGLVTIKAGHSSIQFSPQKSLPKFLSMKPVNGTLVDTYNLPMLQKLYGTTFSGVKISRGTGAKTPVLPQDVAGALRLALKQTSPSKRVQEIPVNGR